MTTEESWRGKKGSLKRHGKTCSKTKLPHDFKRVGSRLYVFTHGALDSEAVYFRCSGCGKKDVHFSFLPKKQ